MARRYHTVTKQSVSSEKQLADVLVRNGQQLLPMVELIEQSRMAVEELIRLRRPGHDSSGADGLG